MSYKCIENWNAQETVYLLNEMYILFNANTVTFI